jgi:hypothetical protein
MATKLYRRVIAGAECLAHETIAVTFSSRNLPIEEEGLRYLPECLGDRFGTETDSMSR